MNSLVYSCRPPFVPLDIRVYTGVHRPLLLPVKQLHVTVKLVVVVVVFGA